MNNQYQKQVGLVSAICGSLLIGLPAIAAQMKAPKLLAQANPSPSVLREAPYNRTQPQAPTPSPVPGGTLQPPLPEQQQPPNVVIQPVDGKVSVMLVNETGANINYQVIGNTNQRSLSGKSNVTLQNLPTPVTVTFKRQDGGLLQVSPQVAQKQGMLEVKFTETTDLGTDKSTMRIQQTGGVFLN